MNRVEWWAKKRLKGIKNYKSMIDKYSFPPEYANNIPLKEAEYLIGIYENTPDCFQDCIVVTNYGLYVFDETTWIFLDFLRIKDTDIPERKTITASILQLKFHDGRVVNLEIKGSKDVFTFNIFLMNVARDLQGIFKDEK